MNYLAKNLQNSFIFPYDIMKIIYEYSDPFKQLRKQIENKECDLDEIMYQRMKTILRKEFDNGRDKYYISPMTHIHTHLIITKMNLDDNRNRDLIINGWCGYKSEYLKFATKTPNICGVYTINGPSLNRSQMIKDLKVTNTKKDYEKRSIKQIYKLWKKL